MLNIRQAMTSNVARNMLRTLAFALALGGAAIVARAADKPVFIELYSSQGCSSCPPADKLLADIAREPGVIALTLPVDYWDYMGWKDTFGSPAHTARQKAYARIRGDGQVYTPQVVINGLAHAVGSDVAAIRKISGETHGKSGAMSVPLTVTETPRGLTVELGAAPAGAPQKANLNLIRVARSSVVAIGRGENSGKTLIYTNVGRAAVRIGEWTGGAQTFEIPRETMEIPITDSWVVVLQAGDMKEPGVVLAAAKAPGL